MELTKQQETAQLFRRWFSSGNAIAQGQTSLKATLDENRRRYRMILKDAEQRRELGLSALASTKSTSIVDNAVVDAIQEYYQTDAITYTAQDDGDVNKDHLAAWLTELFRLRARKNGFWVWHLQSLKAGFVDGMEAAMVRWRKESYDYPDNHYYFLPEGREISEDEYKAAKKLKWPVISEGPFDPAKGKPTVIKTQFNDVYRAERTKKTRTVADTWEVVQLKPGENLLWDFKNPLLDLNRGQWAIVILQMPAEDILGMSKNGIFDKLSMEELKPYLTAHSNPEFDDTTSLGSDPDTVDMGEYNTAEVWLAFERKNYQWEVSFSLKGEKELKPAESVNSVFFGGRPFDRLPIVLGASDIELWEAIGRGIPKLIAPIEDELTDHRNNVNDMTKQAATGKYRVNEDSDVDLNSLLNDKVFFAKPGDVEKLDFSGEMAVVLRAVDMTASDIAALAPVGMSDANLIGDNNAAGTLGGVQLALGGNDKKLNARLLVRNITFMEPLLAIIAEMHMAFETNETLARIAGKNAKIDMQQVSTVVDGAPAIDFSQLDFEVEVQINAGLGTVPKQQKAAKMLQSIEWAKANNRPVDIDKVWKQVMVLNGFNEDQFDPSHPPPPPPQKVDYKATVTVDLVTLLQMAPEAGQFLVQKLMSGGMDVTANVKESKTPDYLKEPQGSPSHPLVQSQQTMDMPQGQMGGM